MHATSQDGSSLEFNAPTGGRECNIQDAWGRGLFRVNDCVVRISDKFQVRVDG